jgi:hypothetical protein
MMLLMMVAFVPLRLLGAGLTLGSVIPLDESGYPGIGIGKYTPFLAESNNVYFIDGKAGVRVKVFSEEYPILKMDYLKEADKILYTYGNGDTAVVAIFDIAEREKYRLDDLTKSDAGRLYYYTVFQDVYWINKNSMVYSVVDPATHETEINVYDLAKKKRTLLDRRPNAAIESYNREEMLLAYSWPKGKGTREFGLIDLKNDSRSSLGVLPYRSVVVVSTRCYLGFAKVRDSQYRSHYQVDIVEDGAIKYSDATSDIIEPIAYLSAPRLLVAYFVKDRILSERAVGVFTVSLAP